MKKNIRKMLFLSILATAVVSLAAAYFVVYVVSPLLSGQVTLSSQDTAQVLSVSPLPSSSSQGTLALGFTDPPNGGRYRNVTSLLVTLTGVMIHSDSNASWISLPLNKTTIDLVAATSLEQLASTLNITNGHYDLIRFTVLSAVAITPTSSLSQNARCPVQSQNPNCLVAASNATTSTVSLKVPSGQIQINIINGGILITSGSVAHLLIDVRINEAPIVSAGVFAVQLVAAKPAGT